MNNEIYYLSQWALGTDDICSNWDMIWVLNLYYKRYRINFYFGRFWVNYITKDATKM